MIISAAAFGQRHPWPQDGTLDPAPPGRKMGFITALKGVLGGTIAKLVLPNVRDLLSALRKPADGEILKPVGLQASVQIPETCRHMLLRTRRIPA